MTPLNAPPGGVWARGELAAPWSEPAGAERLLGKTSGSDAARQELTEISGQLEALTSRVRELSGDAAGTLSRLDIFHGYMGVFVAAFVVALLATPLMRRLAIANGIIDRPSEARKVHRVPVAYLGGVGVFLGLLAGVVFAYTAPFHGLVEGHATKHGDAPGLPVSILLGMTVIMLCGLWDDVVGLDPRAKIAGQLFAAAALATNNIGVKLAAGLMLPVAKGLGIPTVMSAGVETIAFTIPLPMAVLGMGGIEIDVVYWVGTAIIAVFVLGGCNASNLIDGLDGLLSGVTAIAAAGLLLVALGLAMSDNGPLDGARLVLCLALLGACLGFLPHNFNPATIFLGDTGSLLLGYCTIVIILTLGDTGRTDLVLAGLIIYSIPIIDTTLAIARRKIAGKKISDADDQHLHHMLKRALGVKGAVLTLYGLGTLFAALGVALSEGRGRVIYAFTLVFLAFIGVISFKIARRDHIEKQALAGAGGAGAGAGGTPDEPRSASTGHAAGEQTQVPRGVPSARAGAAS